MGKYYNRVLRSKVISSGFSFCKTCSQTKPIYQFYYKSKSGSLYKCKQCISKKQYEYRILRGQKTLEEKSAEREHKQQEFNQRIETETKICSCCGENKILIKFRVSRKNRFVSNICSQCFYEKGKIRYPHLHSSEYKKTRYIEQRKKKDSAYIYKAKQVEREQILQKGYRTCSQCKIEKSLQAFGKRDGFYLARCRECINQKRRLSGVSKRHRLKRKLYFEVHPEEKVKHDKKMSEYAKKYSHKMINNLSHSYVIKKIIGDSCLRRNEIPKELIELKRAQLIVLRAIRKVSNLS